MDLRDLYQDLILEHNRNARNFHEIPGADREVEGFNPLCGDRYTIYLNLDDGVVREIAFTGSGCAISKASASIMCSEVEGMTVGEAMAMHDRFLSMVTGGASLEDALERFGRIAALGGVREFPLRIKCATLAWHALKSALRGDAGSVTTE